MRRVLIADDPDLEPQLRRLSPAVGRTWDVVIAPDDQLEFWRGRLQLNPAGSIGPPAAADSLIEAGEAVELLVAASGNEFLRIASRLAFQSGATVRVLPRAGQPADWIFSLYPLSEGPAPRVHGLFEHRQSTAVRAFEAGLPPEWKDRHLVCSSRCPHALDLAGCEAAFLKDIDLLRGLAGELTTLIAVAVPEDHTTFRSLTITLGGDGAGTVTWMIQPGTGSTWELRQGNGSAAALSRLIDGDYSISSESNDGSAATGSPLATWQDVLRAFDDLAALRRSLKKRRQVELQTEIVSEQAQFKSVMSASGCGLLVATFFGALTLLAAGATFDPRSAQQRTSEQAGLILSAEDFESGTTTLLVEAAAEWPGMVKRLSQTAAPILLERTGTELLDEQRRVELVKNLANAGVESPASRIELHTLRGQVFLKLLTVAWVILFLPLGMFLGMQALLLVAPLPRKD